MVWCRELSKISRSQKPRDSNVSPVAETPPLGRALWVSVCGWYRRPNHPRQILSVSDTPNLPFLKDVSGRPYNSVNYRATLWLDSLDKHWNSGNVTFWVFWPETTIFTNYRSKFRDSHPIRWVRFSITRVYFPNRIIFSRNFDQSSSRRGLYFQSNMCPATYLKSMTPIFLFTL